MRTLSIAILIFTLSICSHADYLDDTTRTQVNDLIASVKLEKTDASNARKRAAVMWTWVNAYAKNRGYVPVNLTQSISSILAYPLNQRPNQYRLLDLYVRELALYDAEPHAIGSLVASGGPFEARKWAMLIQTYTVGQRNIETGGAFLIARHFMPNHGHFQVDDPTGDNYVSIESTNSKVTFQSDTVPLSGMHGGFRGSARSLVFRVVAGSLTQHDQVVVRYGDTRGGSRGLLMPDVSSDYLPFPIYLSLDAKDHFLSLPIQPVVIEGTDIAGVHAFGPSIVKRGEPFTVSIRARDRYFNRPKDPSPSWNLLLNGQVVNTTPPSVAAVVVVEMKGLDQTGIYHMAVESTDGAFSGEGNPLLVEENPTRYIYWGDTHGHSGFAEGIGTPDRFMSWAKEDARLDYVTHSEHDIWMDDHEWDVLIDNVKKYSSDDFIAFLGYEWTIQNFQGGHHNVLFRTADGRKRVPAQTHGTLTKLYQGLRSMHDPRDVVVIPHAHQPGDYRLNDPELEPLVEIMSQHGTFEWFGRMYLNQGHTVGFTAASDNHLSQPGYTAPKGGSLSQRGGLGALIATSKSRDSLFDAMKNLSAYATTGDRIILDVALNDHNMGQRIPFTEDRLITGQVIGTAPIDEIAIVRNGESIWTENYRTVKDDAGDTSGAFQLTFRSASHPHHPGDNPRGWRRWSGSLVVQDANLVSATGMDFTNTNDQKLEVSDNHSLGFATSTRGDDSSIILLLDDVGNSASISLNLVSSREYGGGPPKMRRHQEVPDASLTLNLVDMVDGSVVAAVPAIDYIDDIQLRRVRKEGTRVIAFKYEDRGEVQGDYYYVRVKQANDAVAWSSPIWVGGYSKK